MNLTELVAYATNYSSIILTTVSVLLFVYIAYLHRKLSHFMRGEDGKSLESTIHTYLERVDDLKKSDKLITEHATRLDKRLTQAVRNVSAVRFKAFDQNASNQSFAIALVNELGNGVILSSLHHRDRVSVFAKPISGYDSTHDLTEEELAVLAEAKTAHKN